MVIGTRKPMVFLVSATESGNIRDVLEQGLSSVAEVTPWNRDFLWRPGHFIADILLDFPNFFDFAVAIFGPDDTSVSRGVENYTPRDNVIFEAGMFMSHLGRDRTFIVMPKEPPIKVLTDLSGLVIKDYPPPEEKGGLIGALQPVCKAIANEIERNGCRSGLISPGPKGFIKGHDAVIELLKQNPKAVKPRVVKNIALDMEVTWPIFKQELLASTEISDVQWYSVMLDYRSKAIRNFSSEFVSIDIAQNQEKEILKSGGHLTQALNERNVIFQCKVYRDRPLLHGFLIDNETLLFNMCNLKEGKLHSANYYIALRNEPQNAVATDYITVFDTWFEYHWQNATRTIWSAP